MDTTLQLHTTADAEQEFIRTLPTQLFIDGEWADASDGATSPVEDPSTGATLAWIADASPADGDRALAAASRVQDSWAATPPRERGEILRRAFEMVTARADDFALAMTLEMGKPLAESRVRSRTGPSSCAGSPKRPSAFPAGIPPHRTANRGFWSPSAP